MKQWRLQHGESYLVTGQPVIVADLTGKIAHSIELLLVAVMLVMALTLSLIFRGRPRLLPLGIALLAAALTFGALSVVGASLTVASIAVLPVLVGLAVDYAIQFQSRVEEAFAEEADGSETRPHLGAHPPGGRARGGQARGDAGAPTIATAGIASVGGDARPVALPGADGAGLRAVAGGGRRDRVPLRADRGLGRARAGRAPRDRAERNRTGRAGRRERRVWIGSVRCVAGRRLARSARAAAGESGQSLRGKGGAGQAPRRPGRVLCVGLALAVLGWGLDTQTHVETNIEKLVPQNLESLQNLDALERATGVGGQLDLMVSAKDLTKPATIEWMSSYESAMLKRFGYS